LDEEGGAGSGALSGRRSLAQPDILPLT